MRTRDIPIAEWLGTRPKPAWANIWHLWTVLIPRRTITGRLACGKVWRRHDGRNWIYKRFVEFDHTEI
jgi:hypothetical protein